MNDEQQDLLAMLEVIAEENRATAAAIDELRARDIIYFSDLEAIHKRQAETIKDLEALAKL